MLSKVEWWSAILSKKDMGASNLVKCLLYLNGILNTSASTSPGGCCQNFTFSVGIRFSCSFRWGKFVYFFCITIIDGKQIHQGYWQVIQISHYVLTINYGDFILWQICRALVRVGSSNSIHSLRVKSLEDTKIYTSLILLEWHTRNLSPQICLIA